MGIPLYFRYLVNNYDNILSHHKNIPQTDNLYLDLNCAIHYCCREVLKEFPYQKTKHVSLEHKMIQNVIHYIELLVDYSKPRKLLYIAIDGPAPKAKMVQQRQRRFKKFYEKREQAKIYQKNELTIPEKEEWDTNAITPGTIFMDKLSQHLKKNIVQNEKFKKLEVIFSDSNIPGEGEHKLLHHLRQNQTPEDINVIYGLDADLIMLCMASKKEKILLLRETVEFNNQIHVDGYKFLYLQIDKLKENLIWEIMTRMEREFLSTEEKSMILDDYIFFSFLLGNDFIPHSPTLSIKTDGIDLIIDLYTRYYNELKTNLVNVELKKINHDFLKSIFYDLGLLEDSILLDFTKKRNRKRKPNKVYDSQAARELDLLNLHPQFNRQKEVYIDQGNDDWRERFYDTIFQVDSQYEIDKICHTYLEGVYWNFHYYFDECISWEWNYPYSQPPSYQDIYRYLHTFISNINHLNITKSRPFKPFEQLLMVLPQQSRVLLPPSYQKLMIEPQSDIIEYYPQEYQIETTNKYYLWECQPILPYIISSTIRNVSSKLKLNQEEKERNKLGKIFIKSENMKPKKRSIKFRKSNLSQSQKNSKTVK